MNVLVYVLVELEDIPKEKLKLNSLAGILHTGVWVSKLKKAVKSQGIYRLLKMELKVFYDKRQYGLWMTSVDSVYVFKPLPYSIVMVGSIVTPKR